MSFKFVPPETVKVPDIPYREQIQLPADRTTLIVVDMQNDFVKPDGNLVVPAASETIPRIRGLLESAGEKDVRIAYTQDTQVENDPEFDVWPEHCLKGIWGWEIIEELSPRYLCGAHRHFGGIALVSRRHPCRRHFGPE